MDFDSGLVAQSGVVPGAQAGVASQQSSSIFLGHSRSVTAQQTLTTRASWCCRLGNVFLFNGQAHSFYLDLVMN